MIDARTTTRRPLALLSLCLSLGLSAAGATDSASAHRAKPGSPARTTKPCAHAKHPRRCKAKRRAARRAHRRLAQRGLAGFAHGGWVAHPFRANAATATQGNAEPGSLAPGGPQAGPAAAPPGTLNGPFVKGVNTNLTGWGVASFPQIDSEMNTLGVNWAREDLSWARTEPQRGVYNWSSFDAVLAGARANGISVLPVVGYAPSWSTPAGASDYAAFLAAAVARYGPGTAANLQWWELWNEPYFVSSWSGHTPESEAYARDVLAAAQAAKAIAPTVKLLVAAEYADSPQAGGSTPWGMSWVDDMFAAAPSLGRWIDGVAVHSYGDDPALALDPPSGYLDADNGWSFQRIDTIRARFLAHGMNVPFWITEEGWSTWDVSEATQAHNYADLIPQVRARPWIRALFPFCLREFNAHPSNDQPQYGLLHYGNWQPKPAFGALEEGFKTLA